MMDGIVNGLWDKLAGLVPWWAPWLGWALLALFILWVLSMVKSTFGWPGLAAVLVAAISIVSGLFGFRKGAEWADKRRPVAPPPKKPRGPFGF